MKKIKLLLCFSIFIFRFSFGQITYTQIPMDSELVARNLSTNLGIINVQGIVDSVHAPYDSICLKIYRDSVIVDSIYRDLLYSSGSAPFNFSFQIPAELDEYMVSVYGIKDNIQTLDTTVNALVAGDVYIIDGQSNALAGERDGQNADTNKSEFIRVFGNSDSSTAGLMANLQWFQGEGNGFFLENGHAGQWGLRFGRLIVDSVKIPVAIFNNGCGGTPISYYERPANYKTDSNSNYGRLYYRLKYTGLQNNVRAIFWSQGETDADDGTSTATYVNEFDTLEHSFRQDFPGFAKTIIFQTKTEDIYPPVNLMKIEEAQREVAVAYDTDIEIMATAALKPDAGGLHFDYTGGYEIFGNRLYQLVSRDLYGATPPWEIDAPMITAAYLSDSTTLVIVENADSLEQHNPVLPLSSYEVENTTGAVIDTVIPVKNKIVLLLSKYPGSAATVSYFAPFADTGTNWLTNTNNIELVCFYEYPIADSITTVTMAIANNTMPVLTVYPNPFHNYTNILMRLDSEYQLEVDDITGRKVQEDKFTGKQYQLWAQGLAPGLYFIRIFNSENNLMGTTKVVVQ